jgi:hypothetical protein
MTFLKIIDRYKWGMLTQVAKNHLSASTSPFFFINIQNDSEISLEKKPVIGDDEKS